MAEDEEKAGDRRWESDLLRLLAENSTEYAIFVIDADGVVLTWNPGAERVLGYTEEEIVGRSSFMIFTPEDIQKGEPTKELETAKEQGQVEDERWHVRKDGTRFWASGILTLLRDESGEPRALAKVLRDFTDRRLAEQATRESEERLRVALAAARMGTWRWDIPADRWTLDESLRELFGLSPHSSPAPRRFSAAGPPGGSRPRAQAIDRAASRRGRLQRRIPGSTVRTGRNAG